MTGSWTARLWRLKRQQLLRSKAPILVGPWLSEIGFESLYWLPFLERLIHDGLDRSRLIPITRGGAAAWYGTPKGIEIFGMRTPQDARVEMRQRLSTSFESVKQLQWSPFERQIVKDAAETLGLKHYQTLHPRWMYYALAPFWEANLGLAWLQNHTAWEPIVAPAIPDGCQLPEQFVAVKFYLRPTFGESLIPMAKAAVRQLASQVPVVLLQSGFFADDHADVDLSGPNVIQLRDLALLTPENNLAVQSAVLARSVAFVGTYGGFSQLALRIGKPVVSYYEHWAGTMLTHKHLSDALATIRGLSWQVIGIQDFPLIQSAMPTLQLKEPATTSI